MSLWEIKMRTENILGDVLVMKNFYDSTYSKIESFDRDLRLLHKRGKGCKCDTLRPSIDCIYRKLTEGMYDDFYTLMAKYHAIQQEMNLLHSFCDYWKTGTYDTEGAHTCVYNDLKAELIQKNLDIVELKTLLENSLEKNKR